MRKTISTSLYAISILTMAIMFNVMINGEKLPADPPKKLLKNGWTDLNEYRSLLGSSNLSPKKMSKRAKKDLIGTSVRFKGYMKLIKPHFAEEYDYFFSRQLDNACLPIVKSKAYCGKNNPNYFRVIFNGTGASKRDMMIMQNPSKNKYISQKGDLQTTLMEDGNYEISTYDKSYNLEAKIKDIHMKCLDKNCDENVMTVHIDDWKFTKLP